VPGLRHNRFGPDDLVSIGAAEPVRDIYRRLCDAGGPVAARSFADAPRPSKAYGSAVRMALELEAAGEDRQRRIKELETLVRYREIDICILKDLLNDARGHVEEKATWVRILEERLTARRHRYADQAANLLLKITSPLRSDEPGEPAA
jgi:uncharacterized coiled-coil protein SlyX